MSTPNRKPELQLPGLRQELQLFPGAPTVGGAPTWLIHDPVRHRYFQISDGAIDLLRCWLPTGLGAFRAHVMHEIGREPSEDEVRQLVQFIYANNLSETPADGNPLSYAAQMKGMRKAPLLRAVHGYLFFRIPLVRPAGFLAATLPLVAPLYSRPARVLLVCITTTGLYLASRQWDSFTATVLSLLSLEGVLLYAVALAFVKILHELGHAYTATRYGVRVNTMGVAFMVMMPLLYTDVSDAWRLTSRRRKLAIDAAGVAVELSLAGIATFMWVFLPDGPVRAAVFIVATTSWVLSLMVNLNPLMRFDGYYLLSDAWGIPNLQSRAFALARWQLREGLFGLRIAPPEPLPPRTRRWLIAYAFATWVYRLFLFIGIALLVYHMFFKVLGVALFVIELLWFIALPIGRELVEWWKLRKQIMATRRTILSLTSGAGCIALLMVPWNGTIVIPATTWSVAEMRLFPSSAARIEDVRIVDGGYVEKGQVLARLHSDELAHKQAQVALRLKLLGARLDRIAGDPEELSERPVLLSQLGAAEQERAGFEADARRLEITAPFGGRIRDLVPDLHRGRTLKANEPIGRLISGGGETARGYVNEEDLWRISPGSGGWFIPDDPQLPAQKATIEDIARSGTSAIDNMYLASVYGGPIGSEVAPGGSIRPRAGIHFVRFRLDGAGHDQVVRGVIHIAGKPESFAAAAWRRILKVLVRESGA